MSLIARFAAITGSLLALAIPCLGAPSVTTLSPAPDATVQSLTSISVSFNELVSGIDPDDLVVNGETAASVSGSGAGPYVFTFTQPAPGAVSVSWEFDHGIAGLGTGAFVLSGSWSYTLVDTIVPTIAKVRTSVAGQEQDAIVPLPNCHVTTLTRVEVVFSEPVTGVDASDLLINGNPATLLIDGEGAGPYVFSFPQPPSGTVGLDWASGHGIADTAATPNAFGGGGWVMVLDPNMGRNLVITEFLAANATSVLDENTDPSGWIEIFNAGPTPVSLAGWSLSNDSDNLRMWVFPARSIAANSRLYLFASGKDRKPPAGNLHTNFQLSTSGGYLALTPPESNAVPVSSYDPYPVQRYDYSYGVQSAGGLRYFARIGTGTDTRPGSANPLSALTTVTPAPTASVSRGIFSQPFALILSCSDATATIRFTLDGSEPLANSPAYTQPLPISSTTVLRMAAFGAASVSSETVTHSYIFPDQVVGQASPPYDNPASSTDNSNPPLPSIGGTQFPINWGTLGGQGFPGQITNLPTDTVPADYGMDPEVYGNSVKYAANGSIDNVGGKTNLERIKQSFRDLPVLSVVLKMDDAFGPNGLYPKSIQKTPPIEKACSVELIPPDGSAGFMVTCGIRPHGNSSRNPSNSPKHSFKLKFKGDYGGANLEYRLFPDSAVEKLDDIVLRADYNTSWIHWDPSVQRPKGTRQRDAWSKHTFRDMGREAGHHRYVHLFINGLYWGTYDATEQENENYARNHYGGEKEDYDIVEQGVVKNGTATAYNTMVAIANSGNFAVNTTYEQMKRYLDIPQFVDYMLLHFFIGHEDWATEINKNWYAIRNAKKNGTFKYLPWDQENILFSQSIDRTGVATPPSGLHPKLFNNPQYRLDFADRVNRHMLAPDGALIPAANIARWNYWKDLLANALVAESARWGDYRRDVHVRGAAPLYTWNQHAVAEHSRLTGTYFPQRTDIVMVQLRNRGLYPTLNAPELRASSNSALLGRQRVAAGFQVKMQLPTSLPSSSTNGNVGTTQIYFTTDGTDPRVYYAGTIAATAQVYFAPLTVNSTTTIKARTYDSTGGAWSALNEVTLTVDAPLIPKVRITELMYNPAGGTAYEFIEFQNAGMEPVNMSGWYLDGVEFVFPGDTILEPGSRLVIASNDNPIEWVSRYPGVVALGNYGGSLNNAGERVTLYDRLGRIVVSVDYDDGSPWPTAADGSGYTLELADVDGDPDSPFSWKTSTSVGGSPGTQSPNGHFATSVQISEVFVINNGAVTNGGFSSPFIELRNTGGTPANISGWQVQAPGSIYIIPDGTIIPVGGFLVIWIDNAFEAPGLHAPLLALPHSGGGVRLCAAGETKHARDQVAYGAQAGDHSIGRIGAGWVLANPTPGAANAAAATASLTAVSLNEWLANQSAQDEADWVELYNGDASLPIALQGLYLRAGSRTAQIRQLSFIEPHGFLRLFVGEAAQQLDITLPASGTTLDLFDAGGELLESVAVSAAVPGETEGRFPDGTAAFFKFGLNPTPGAPNVLISNYSGPVLNELLVVNSTRETAPWGARTPYVELRNEGGSSFDLSGFGLSNRLSAPSNEVYRFPSGTVIPASGYLVVWLGLPSIGQPVPSGTLATAIPLVKGGGALYLLNASDNVVDSVEWGSQVTDLSIGRIATAWQLLASTTAGAANSAAASLGVPSSLKLNEWLAAPSGGPDFVELFNDGSAPVELTGLYLTDDPSTAGLSKYQIPPLSFIGPRDWARFIASSNPATGFDAEANFALSAEGEYLRLSAADLSLVDAIGFGLQTTGRSEGRILDGENIFGGLIPTPGGRNILPPAPTISDHPDDQTVNAGVPVSFSVTATGANPLSYQWYFNGIPIAGATGPTLQIQTVTLAHDGGYTCVVTNTAGSDTSNPGYLRVNGTYDQWRAFYFSAGELSDNAISGPAADADRDGLSNLEEFFHGLDPRSPLKALERGALPEAGIEPATGTPQYLTLSFRRASRAADVTVELESSTNLASGSWDGITPSIIETLPPDPVTGDPRVKWKVAISGGESEKFLRLKLTP